MSPSCSSSMLDRIILSMFLFLLLFLNLSVSSVADDGAVMASFAAALSPAPSDWNSETAFCKWSGVNCDGSGRVTSISLASRSLSGSLPSDLNSLSALQTLSLQRNSLSGSLPSLSNLSSLQEAYFDSNNFTSIPTSCFSNLIGLQTLSVNDNPNLAPWSIPEDLTQSTSLVTLYAGNASIMGSIPDFFDKFSNLQNLRLSYNNLTGSLPSSFAGSGIQYLWLNNQEVGLSGTIDVLGSMSELKQVWLQANGFTGQIPDLSKCQSLFDLQLRDNQFTGVVPSSLMSLPSLVNITLQINKLQGPVPEFGSNVLVTIGTTNSFCRSDPGPCDSQVTILLEIASAFDYPMVLATSWTGNNACQQWTFVSCLSNNVTVVNFAMQHFSGTISPAFANLTSLKSLYLNDNNLTGPIPESLTTLTQLTTLDVSNNNLTGTIPVFPLRVNVKTTGNLLLGTNSSSGGGGGSGGSSSAGSGSTSPDASPSGQSSSASVSPGLIAGVVVSVVVFIGVVLFVVYKCYFQKCHQKFGRVQSPENGKEMHFFEGGNIAISIQVLRHVTNNFSEDNILGRGGFGVVYRGELHDGTKVAVKRMESVAMGTKAMNGFQAEIAVLTKVRHRHLVALLGYCKNGNDRLLVYEYMPQGTLGQHLFDWPKHGYTPLTWKQRVTIALDVARGIEYLHSLAQQSFIHRDLKPSNILLGDDMRAKVADFGLVKNAPDGKYSVETRLAGTLGYLAPEYAATGRVTSKVDVYSYGVVLMELITGRKALDETLPDERSHLVTWFQRVLINKDTVRNAIDQTLDPDEESYESICKVTELAGHCTAREPSQRPDMSHAVNILGPLVEQWKPTCHDEDESYSIDSHVSLPQALQRWHFYSL